MKITDYKKYCEEFFQQERFQSIEVFNKEITELSLEQFREFQDKLFDEYNKKDDIIRDMIKDIRTKANFNVRAIDVDWEKDPVKKKEHQLVIHAYRDIYNNVFNENIAKFESYAKKYKEWQDHMAQKRHEESLKITVNGKDYVAEKVIEVLWSGWECDGSAWLVNDNGKMRVVMTNHGSTYFAEKSALEEKVKEYQDAIKNTQDMINAL